MVEKKAWWNNHCETQKYVTLKIHCDLDYKMETSDLRRGYQFN